MAAAGVGVGRLAGARALALLEDEHRAGCEVGVMAAQGRARGPGRQAAAVVPPGVEEQVVEVGEQVDRPRRDRLEPLRAGGDGGPVVAAVGLDPRGHARHRGAEREVAADHGVGADRELEPRARVAAVVHRVVDQRGVAAERRPPARGAEVALGRHRVLPVAQVVADVGQELDERDPEVGRVALAPVRREQRQPVEHQAAEARVVLGQVVDLG